MPKSENPDAPFWIRGVSGKETGVNEELGICSDGQCFRCDQHIGCRGGGGSRAASRLESGGQEFPAGWGADQQERRIGVRGPLGGGGGRAPGLGSSSSSSRGG
ncbi:unnamed protein product [Rangifer tarandus platyrhynchus]|uniref:Uncharacterized protein n=1 Tax=Rangifer tarandus platyrhynchus TaxID=3082113 RepID=A0AC59YKK4_RANTA